MGLLGSYRERMPSLLELLAKETARIRPLVRPARTQAEIDLLPPYGDPEVHLLCELGTYILVGSVINTLLTHLES